ncbi:MAG: addiction module protein [Betaproteobacteria bacterium]|jgi:putative addiction module component (TIGR02574 family)
MASVFEEVVLHARELSARERLRLVDALLRELAALTVDDAGGVAAAWDAEIDRRLDEMEAGRVDWVSHEEVMARGGGDRCGAQQVIVVYHPAASAEVEEAGA